MFQRFTFLWCSFAFILASSPLATQAASTPIQKEWTFLVFLNGNNNLDSFGGFNINQMENVGSTDKINVVVQWASLSNNKTQRLFVQKDNDTNKVTSPIVQDLGAADMGDYRTLIEFIRWGAENYPAKHYFVDVWDHGSGWHAINAKARGRQFHPTDISWDDNTGHFMTTQQLGLAMAEGAKIIGHKIDIYGSDACLMAMAEVAGEMKDSVEVFLGSEELEPGAGWPYDDILKAWNTKKRTTPAAVAKIVTNAYVKSYTGGQNGSQEVTFSAFDLSQTGKFEASIRALGQSILKLDAPSRTQVLAAFRGGQQFYYDDYRDVGHVVELLEKANITSLERDRLADVKSALGDYVIANAVTKFYAAAKGVSMWMPSSAWSFNDHIENYKTLTFNAGTDWASSLGHLLQEASPPPVEERH